MAPWYSKRRILRLCGRRHKPASVTYSTPTSGVYRWSHCAYTGQQNYTAMSPPFALRLFSLTALAGLAAATIRTYDGNATLWTPSFYPGACGTIVHASDHAVALSANLFSTTLCGQIVAIENTDKGFGGEVTVGDLCDECAPTDIKITSGGYVSLAGGADKFPAEWVLGIFD
ncbi:hypothetical protein MIND_00296600 [Mycena indigotica]|uniref:Uncharacterized protein n=1 Tax=Mycena indigotica TaxID=2126181 RepID=A0A8H6T1H2_9AGAR|nr:uncharacterized protein MIND_00296600 [Mycena indigotica]KAF7309263.1 hypothetical protein MIND_00296600 [Mycena indigotica]